MVSVESSMNESSKATEAASYATTASEAWNWNESQLAELNRHLDKSFGEVERFNQALAFTLWMDGHLVELWANSAIGWIKTDAPMWGPLCRYRIAPKPEPLVLPSIDWSAVAEKYRWLAQDECGICWLYENEPKDQLKSWQLAKCSAAQNFASLKPGKGDWKKLIVERPQ